MDEEKGLKIRFLHKVACETRDRLEMLKALNIPSDLEEKKKIEVEYAIAKDEAISAMKAFLDAIRCKTS